MKKEDEVKKYRKETTLELIDEYKDLIDKIFIIAKKDLLDAEINKAKGEESEKKYLDKIAHREKALDRVQDILDKIENIENKHLREKDDEDNNVKNDTNTHPSKRRAKG